MGILDSLITKKIADRADDWARMADAGDIVQRWVAPALPKTIDLFEPGDVTGPANYEGDRSKAGEVHVNFAPLDLSTEQGASLAYGTIIKIAGGLVREGWIVDPVPVMAAYSFQEGMDITVKAKRTIPGRRRLFRRDIAARTIPLHLVFEKMPETSRCRIEESVEEVPASTRTVKRVVCEELEDGGLLSAVAIPSPALTTTAKEAERPA